MARESQSVSVESALMELPSILRTVAGTRKRGILGCPTET